MGTSGCRTCLRLRLFLGAALPLVAMIYLQPQGAVRLAAIVPSPALIAGGLVLACAVGFWVRLRALRQDSAG